MIIMPNPYDDERFVPAWTVRPPSPVLGFVGRLVAYKQCELVLHCAASMRPRHPGLHVIVAGDGQERSRLQQLARQLRLAGCVTFLGDVAQPGLPAVYRQLDVLIVPSKEEPFGLVALEAAACGTPVIVASSGGLAELSNPPHILAFDNADDLIAKVEGLLDRPRDRHANAARSAWVRDRYGSEAYVRALQDAYMVAAEQWERRAGPLEWLE
jgi:glycogen(starch) synthase